MKNKALRIEPLTSGLIPLLNDYLMRDALTNVLVLRDLNYPWLRKDSKFWIALKDKQIEGSLLIFHEKHHKPRFLAIWLNGSREAVQELLGVIKVSKAIFHVIPEHADLVEKKFLLASKVPAELMAVKKGKARICTHHPVKMIRTGSRLKERLRLENIRITKKALRDVRERDKVQEDIYRYGIFVGKELGSITSLAKVTDKIYNIGWTFTKREHRRKGFATSTLSRAVRDGFEKRGAELITLFVLSANLPAKHVYKKIGFRKVREMTWFDLGTGLLRKSLE